MKRRDFITLLGGSAAAWPLPLSTQQPVMPVIGYLGSVSPGVNAHLIAILRESLADAGFIEGRSLAIAYRWAEGQYDRLPALAAELVRRQVAVIVATPTVAALAAKAATATIPIVFTGTEDPVKLGLVSSLARPGGNATGVYFFLSDLAAKQLGLLRELVPAAARIGLLVNPQNPNAEAVTREVTAATSAGGVAIDVVRASDSRGIESPASGSRTRLHAFTHGPSCPSRHKRTSLKCPCLCDARARQGRCAPGRRRLVFLQPPAPARHLGDAPCDSRRL
jgi:ABC transporter substrate binding protein